MVRNLTQLIVLGNLLDKTTRDESICRQMLNEHDERTGKQKWLAEIVKNLLHGRRPKRIPITIPKRCYQGLCAQGPGHGIQGQCQGRTKKQG